MCVFFSVRCMPKVWLRLYRVLRKWIKLSASKRRLYLGVFCLSGIVRVVILLLPFRWIAGRLGSRGMESAPAVDRTHLKYAQIIGHVIAAASRYTPWESRCLVQAVTAKIMLRRYRISNTLYLGIKKDQAKILVAHAWLRVGPHFITGGDVSEKFTVLAFFGDV